MFIDSDDYVDSQVLGDLIDRLRRGVLRADVIVTDYYFVEHPAKKLVPIFQIGENNTFQRGMDFLPVMLKRRQCFWNVWRYIYRRDFLLAHDIQFLENMLSEDVDYTSRVLLSEPDIVFSHSPFYYYNVGRGCSLMDRCDLKRLTDTVQVLYDSIRRMREASIPYADLIAARFQFEYFLSIAMVGEVEKCDRKAACELFADADEVLGRSADALIQVSHVLLRILNVKRCAWLLHIAKLLRRHLLGRKKDRRTEK